MYEEITNDLDMLLGLNETSIKLLLTSKLEELSTMLTRLSTHSDEIWQCFKRMDADKSPTKILELMRDHANGRVRQSMPPLLITVVNTPSGLSLFSPSPDSKIVDANLQRFEKVQQLEAMANIYLRYHDNKTILQANAATIRRCIVELDRQAAFDQEEERGSCYLQ